jgi:hypothetical protein
VSVVAAFSGNMRAHPFCRVRYHAAEAQSRPAMKTILLSACCAILVACSSYRELTSPRIANEVILAEFHKGGMTIGRISNPLGIASWELRIASSGSVEQRLYDESSGKWRVFEGPAIEKTELGSILSECETLPAGEPIGRPVYLGRIATDTTYLRIGRVKTRGQASASCRSNRNSTRCIETARNLVGMETSLVDSVEFLRTALGPLGPWGQAFVC